MILARNATLDRVMSKVYQISINRSKVNLLKHNFCANARPTEPTVTAVEPRVIDLRSDTVTQPSLEMRKVIASARVGDDVYGEDPTVKELEERSARLFAKESALFVPTGTMANLIAIMAHCWRRGSEVLLGDCSHIHMAEQGGVAAIASVHSRTLQNRSDGTFSLEELVSKIRYRKDSHVPYTTLICLENTHNVCYGSPIDTTFTDEVCKIGKKHNIGVHLDGARIFNACRQLRKTPSDLAKNCDSVSFCLSKGLGCPAGSLIVASKQFIEKAERCRKILGGGMRQSGILAAAGIYALQNNVDRLVDDHKHALMIARAISEKQKAFINIDVNKMQTNIGYIDVDPSWMTAKQFSSRMQIISEEEKFKFGNDCAIVKLDVRSDTQLRFLTHLDVSLESTLLAIEKIKFVIDNQNKL